MTLREVLARQCMQRQDVYSGMSSNCLARALYSLTFCTSSLTMAHHFSFASINAATCPSRMQASLAKCSSMRPSLLSGHPTDVLLAKLLAIDGVAERCDSILAILHRLFRRVFLEHTIVQVSPSSPSSLLLCCATALSSKPVRGAGHHRILSNIPTDC